MYLSRSAMQGCVLSSSVGSSAAYLPSEGNLQCPPHAGKTDGSEGAGNGGNDSGKQGHKQRGVNTLHDQAVVKEFLVPAQGEALPHGVALAGVEGEDNKNEDRRV